MRTVKGLVGGALAAVAALFILAFSLFMSGLSIIIPLLFFLWVVSWFV